MENSVDMCIKDKIIRHNVSRGTLMNSHETGRIGEDLAVLWLLRHNHQICSRNFRLKNGEIDIVSHETNGIYHCVEVKTVSYETREKMKLSLAQDWWFPEERVTREKLFHMKRTFAFWREFNNISGLFQFDVCAVHLVRSEKYAEVQYIDNVS